GKTRYPAISLRGLKELKPELILLSSEPFPFKEQHIVEVKEACPSSNIQLVDGEWFSWYGSRMIYAFRKLKNWRTFI
ncbi:MAG: helical backbone metal receptor, partial [Balneolales bacterium]|nr:helical backbone metal receptor [Balneolales bacterium]